jgi:XTP/dITP diphosphohydrolase
LPSDNQTVWFMTENPGKFREASSILTLCGIRVRHLRRSKLEIQADQLENIAKYALKIALEHYDRPIVLEDSGLFIESLKGFPGPFSSHALKTIGLQGILDLLGNRGHRAAYFRSALAYGSVDSRPRVFTGTVRGSISRKILGRNGFGFDPIFVPSGSSQTFGQSQNSLKNQRSHRAKAFLKFAAWYRHHEL